MKSKNLGILSAGPALAIVGIVLATAGVSDDGSRVAVPVIAAIGVLVTGALTRFQPDRATGTYLLNLMLLGVAVRLFLFTGIHQTVGPYVFAPDQWTYESRGMGLLSFWRGIGPFPSRIGENLQVGYPTINAVLFYLFGFAKSAPAILNIFCSVWAAIPVYHLAMLLVRRNEGVARLAAGLTVFFPSLILWSVLNIREAPTILVLAASIHFAVRLQHHPSFGSLAGLVVGLSVLTVFREYLTLLLGTAIVAGIFIGRSGSPFRALVAGSVLLFTLAFAAQALGLGGTLAGEPSLDQVQAVRQGFLYDANSAYGRGADLTTPAGALAFLPIGLAYFLLAPFPWAIGSTLQAITLPETLLWYAILPMGIWGAVLAIRHDIRMFTVPLASLILITLAYALVEANVGTAYRHRAQILPVIFVFCAVGIRDVLALRAARLQRVAESRSRMANVSAAGQPRRGGTSSH